MCFFSAAPIALTFLKKLIADRGLNASLLSTLLSVSLEFVCWASRHKSTRSASEQSI